jgi:hypothetical protein
MRIGKLVLLLILLLQGPTFAQSAPQSHLLTMRGQGLVVGILPEAGGRMVLLRSDAGANWLDSDTTQWNGSYPQPGIDAPFSYSLFGAVVWAGPQSAFWSDQDLDAKRKAQKAVWPPDPFAEWGRCAVEQKDDHDVSLRLPGSPISGLQMTKRYVITGQRQLTMEVTATNARDREVLRDLWPDIHIDPIAEVEVPARGEKPLRVARLSGPEMPQAFARNAEAVTSPGVTAGPTVWSAKAFIHAACQRVLCRRGNECLLLAGSLDDPARLHPEHAAVELYRQGGEHPRLEVEMHGRSLKLAPGESMHFRVTFYLDAQPTSSTPQPASRVPVR